MAKNGLRPVARGERVVVDRLSKELVAAWEELDGAIADRNALHKKLVESAQHAGALLTLFWERVEKISERTETAEARGNVLGIRDGGGHPVIVEAPAGPGPVRILALTPEQLRHLLETGKAPDGAEFGG